MSLESALDIFPKEVQLKNGSKCQLRPLQRGDEVALHACFLAMPTPELMYLKHRVMDLDVVREWCENIDLGRNFPLLAVNGSSVWGVCTLHQQLGGWKRHIGRVSVHVHPHHRGHGLARTLVNECIDMARMSGLEKVEAEFIGGQESAVKMFGMLGFSHLMLLPDYVKDMQAVTHDYILMGLDLITDEEYAGAGG